MPLISNELKVAKPRHTLCSPALKDDKQPVLCFALG